MSKLTKSEVAALPPSVHLGIIERALIKAQNASAKSRAWGDAEIYRQAQDCAIALKDVLKGE